MSSDEHEGDSAAASSKAQAKLPPWIALGKKLHWWSESQKKNMSVRVTKIDDKKNLVIVTFEVDEKVWKSVPFSKIGQKDCPLRKPEEAAKKEDGSATKKEKKRKASKERSATPDWSSKEYLKMLHEKEVQRELKAEEEKRKEEERKKEEKKRQELVAAEKRKVEQAFEKRKREAEAQKLREEEEWRKNLIKQRQQEAAEEEVKQKEKEERRKKRKEEKEKRDKELGIVKKPKPEPKPEPKPVVVPPRKDVPELPAGITPPPVALTGAQLAQPWLLAGAAQQMAMSDGQMPVHMMQMMAAQAQAAQAQAGLGDLSGAGAGFAGAGLAGAWGAGSQVAPNLLPGAGVAQWAGQFANMAQNPGSWASGGKGQFQAPWGSG